MATSTLVQVSSSSCFSRIVHWALNGNRSRPLCKGSSVLSPDVSALATSGGEGFFSYGFFLSNFLVNLWVKSANAVTLAWLKCLNHRMFASPSRWSTAISTTSFSTTGCSRKNASNIIPQALAVHEDDPSKVDNRNLLPFFLLFVQGLLSSLS